VIYTQTLKTYNSGDCTAVGLLIRSNKTTVSVTKRTRWQGSREKTWVIKGCEDIDGTGQDGHHKAKVIHQLALEEGWSDALEEYGLTDENTSSVGPVIR
jgi:hypothetical protein